MPKETLYLSYARNNKEDRDLMQRIKEILQDSFDFVEYHPPKQPLNENDIQAIQAKLRQAKKIIFIFSLEAYASYQCYIELSLALGNYKSRFFAASSRSLKIIPVSWRSISTPIPAIMDMVSDTDKVGDFAEEKRRVDIVRDIRDRVNKLDWINFHLLREAEAGGNTETIEKVQRRQILELLEAVHEPLPTWRAFLSYARENKDYFVLHFKDALASDKETIWFDEDSITPAKEWLEEIYRGIEKSRNFICLITTEWLTSPNCYAEYEYARKYNKRIIPLVVEEFDEDKCKAHLKNDPWKDGENILDAPEVLDKINRLLAECETEMLYLKDISADLADFIEQHWSIPKETAEYEAYLKDSRDFKLQPIVDEIAKIWGTDVSHIDRHTKYLINAREYERKEGQLLKGRELRAARQWFAEALGHPYPPSASHQRFINDSYQAWIRNTLFAVLSVVSLIFVFGGLLLFSIQRDLLATRNERDAASARADAERVRAESFEALSRETNERLQVQATYAELVSYPLSSPPTNTFFHTDGSLWLPLDDNSLVSLALNGLGDSLRFSLEADPETIIAGFDYLWINNRAAGTVSRLDPQHGSIEPIPVGRISAAPVFTNEAIWLRGVLSENLIALDPRSLAPLAPEREISAEAGDLFSSGESLWYIDQDGESISYIRGVETNVETISLSADLTQGFYQASSNSVIVLAGSQVFVIDADSYSLVATKSLGGLVAALRDDGVYLWGILLDGTGIVRINPRGEVQKINIPNSLDIAIQNGKLWIYQSEALLLWDAVNLSPIAEIRDISNPRQLSHPVSDGRRAWFSQSTSGSVYLIDETRGELLRQLTLCEELSSAYFDGAMMWMVCPLEPSVIAVPADIHFFGTGTVLNDTENHQAIIRDDILWLSQAGTGRVITFDMQKQEEIHIFEFGQPILALVDDGTYLWTALVDGKEVYRINPSLLDTDYPEQSPELISSITTGHNINYLHVMGEFVWLQSLSMNDSQFLSIIGRESLAFIEDTNRENLVGGVNYFNNEVWTSTLEVEYSLIRWLAPDTGRILDEMRMPLTVYASYEPFDYDNLMWFTAVIPPPRLMPEVIAELNNPDSEAVFPFYLIAFNPETHEMVRSYPLPSWTDFPRAHERLFWFRLMARDITRRTTMLQVGNGVIAVNIDTGKVLSGNWTVCAYDSPVFLAGEFAWLGCIDVDDSFGVISSEQEDLRQYYDSVGVWPNAPLELADEDRVVFTFADSDTAAVFNRTTGELLQTMQVGHRPQSPFIYRGEIWVYNDGSDTLQRIRPN